MWLWFFSSRSICQIPHPIVKGKRIVVCRRFRFLILRRHLRRGRRKGIAAAVCLPQVHSLLLFQLQAPDREKFWLAAAIARLGKKGFLRFCGGSGFVGGATDMAIFFWSSSAALFLAGQEFVLPPLKFEGGQDSLFCPQFCGGEGECEGPRESGWVATKKRKGGAAWKWPQKWSREQL